MAALWSGTAAAQNPSPYTTVTPWPSQQPRPGSYAPVPAGQSPWSSARPSAEPPRTLYYKKDNYRTGVVPAAAADLAAPLAAGQQPAKPVDPGAGQPRVPTTDPLKPIDPEIAEPRKKGPDGVEPVFRLESENQMVVRENLRRAMSTDKEKIIFPAHPTSAETGQNRPFAPMQMVIEPNFVCHGRLLFEDKNTERYGWAMGPLQPLFSSLQFLSDFSNLPYKFFSFPRLWYDCSAGQCLPGDPVPWLLYPPGLSAAGFLGQAGTTAALYAIFP
jgi:hypothetical protein